MINYTTPTITLTVEGADITADDVYVTLKQGNIEFTRAKNTLNIEATSGRRPDTVISFTLTQQETARFNTKDVVQAQVNWINSDGIRAATGIALLKVKRNLLDEVINYGN